MGGWRCTHRWKSLLGPFLVLALDPTRLGIRFAGCDRCEHPEHQETVSRHQVRVSGDEPDMDLGGLAYGDELLQLDWRRVRRSM